MSDSEIPVRLKERAPSPTAGVVAVLHEIVARLERLLGDGEKGAIELHSLPMTHADRRALEDLLGVGEVRATLDIMGRSTVRETACHGVWWSEHRNVDGRVIAETLEITDVPEILVTPSEDIADCVLQLNARLNEWPASAGGDDHER